ncbi:MAG: 2-C-methyl-D-erythritol 2,4-cyclodiphosphate synthase [Actinomycetota bacterium]
MRIGLGFDAHAFDEHRPLVLGGIVIPDAAGLSGHSDADVLSHAIADALLGAARLGDLGALYPETEEWRGAASIDILSDARHRALAERWEIVNVDATVVAQRPRLAPHRAAMVISLEQALAVDAGIVSVKATTTDGLGFTGRGEGIAALAVVLMKRTETGATTSVDPGE